MRMTVGAVAIALLAAGAVQAAPVTVTINSVSGSWGDVTGGPSNLSGEGTEEIRWGSAATSNGRSGYRFDGAPASGPFGIDQEFTLGTFTHFNNPIFASGGSITGATLTVDFDVSIANGGGISDVFTSVFEFTHFETPNDGSPCAAGGNQPCPDLVTAIINPALSESVTLDGVEYFFSVSGFETSPGSTLQSFLTDEEATNAANLRGSFTADVAPIPLPAAGWMLMAGIGALGAAARRRRS